jgi:hypothetical protein
MGFLSTEVTNSQEKTGDKMEGLGEALKKEVKTNNEKLIAHLH